MVKQPTQLYIMSPGASILNNKSNFAYFFWFGVMLYRRFCSTCTALSVFCQLVYLLIMQPYIFVPNYRHGRNRIPPWQKSNTIVPCKYPVHISWGALHIEGLMQNCNISIANALGFCTLALSHRYRHMESEDGIHMSLWNRPRGTRSRHSRRMRNLQFYVSGKRSMHDVIQTVLSEVFVR